MNCKLITGKTEAEGRQICLNCPFPRCVFDFERIPVRPEFIEGKLAHRNAQIRQLARQGHTTAELQTVFKLSRRTIQRALHGVRGARDSF